MRSSRIHPEGYLSEAFRTYILGFPRASVALLGKALRGCAGRQECFGSGINVHLNQDEPKCRNCSGTGACSTCEGTGRPIYRWGTHRLT